MVLCVRSAQFHIVPGGFKQAFIAFVMLCLGPLLKPRVRVIKSCFDSLV